MHDLRKLADDGLELLGDLELGSRIVVGDPGRFASPDGAIRLAIAHGRWALLGRAWERDPDVLSELVLVHEAAAGNFYAHYDDLVPGGEADLPGGRVAVLDASIAADLDVVASLYEPDELPWVLAAGVVAGEGPGGPARIFRSSADPIGMIMIALGAPPLQRAPAPELVVEDD